jgi:predicted dehydrogenase
MKPKLNVAIIGHNFMGRAHSQAWRNAPLYFDLDAEPVLKLACGRSEDSLRKFANTWGWHDIELDWRKAIERPEIDIVDISTPTSLHCEMAVAALEAGKHVFCEKPFAIDEPQAQRMCDAARRSGKVHYLNHNYRRCPAVLLAKQMIDEGRIGRIYQWRGAYLQSWIMDENFPLTWHLRREFAGAGPHWDLNSHSVDLARFLVGEIRSVSALTAQFIAERPLPGAGAATFSAGSGNAGERAPVTVEDAAVMIVEFANGALGTFETSRFAAGRKNYNTFEIYGARGAVAFNLERMNELQYFAGNDSAHAQGFRTILATESCHPYIANWWPPGHVIGYEHEFTHAVVDFIRSITRGEPIWPNFEDGLKCIQVLQAGLDSARSGQRVRLDYL